MLFTWWHQWRASRRQARWQSVLARRAIDEALWQATLDALPFVACLPGDDLKRLRMLVSLFLDGKEFSGAHGLQTSDAQAVMVACQACLPILHIAPSDRPDLALAWYDGFVGIVLHAGEVRARREWVDDDGIAHSGSEDLTGEILEGGPLMLSWSDVENAGQTAGQAYNVVIHEFIHVMDVRDGQADGCPPMPPGQRSAWHKIMQAEYAQFCIAMQTWQRFGVLQQIPAPLLDPYGMTSVDEFFAVAAEAYFVQRGKFMDEYPALGLQFDAFFLHKPA